jgi:phytoene dehydrogenase-like protein
MSERSPIIIDPGMSKTLPGLEWFYMAGQSTEPGGGGPAAAVSVRTVIRLICQRNGVRFATSVP